MMTGLRGCAGVAFIALAVHSVTHGASRAPTLILFGDSLTDTGNMYTLSNASEPSVSYYFSGRFSNGPVWADWVNPDFTNAMPRYEPPGVINYAVGGATACPGTPLLAGGSVADQLARFASSQVPYKDVGFSYQQATEAALASLLKHNWQPGNKTAAMMILIGSNDYIGALVSAVTQQDEQLIALMQELPARLVNCTMSAVRQLISLVSRPPDPRRNPRSMAPPPGPVQALVVASLPPIEVTPLVTNAAPPLLVAAIQQSLQVYNSRLQQEVRRLAVDIADGSPQLSYFDLYTAVLQVRNTASAAGVSDVTTACLSYGLALPILHTLLTRDMLDAQAAAIRQHTIGNEPPASASAGRSAPTTSTPQLESRTSNINPLNTTLLPVSSVCSDPGNKFFYDAVHPTTKVHRLTAIAIQKGLIDASLGNGPWGRPGL